MNNNIGQFIEVMKLAGLSPPNVIEPGKFHRFPGKFKGNTNNSGWCKLFADGKGGVYGDYSQLLNAKWQAKSTAPLTPSRYEAVKRQIAKSNAMTVAGECKKQSEAANKAKALWRAAKSATPIHAYLLRKGIKDIKAHGAKVDKGSLVIPVCDGGIVHSLQFIDADGEKRFLSGGRLKGCYSGIGTIKDATVLCIAEGFATGATIHEATGYPVAAAFNAGNLEAVAIKMRDKFPDMTLIVCADDDYKTDGNPGLTKAKAAAIAVGGKLAIPDFGENRPNDATDFNDMCVHCDAEAVKRAIEAARLPDRGMGQPAQTNATESVYAVDKSATVTSSSFANIGSAI
jgi:putative DNA primase/helicase